MEILFVRERTNSLTPRLAAYSAEFGRGRMFAALGEVLNFAVIRSDRIQGEGITFKAMPRKSFRRHLEREAMSYKTMIAAVTALALSPAIAFAAPATTIVKTKPAVTKQVKMEKITMKKQQTVKKPLVAHKAAKAKAVTKI